MVTLVHFHLINSIMVGKKKTNDVQFYTEARRPHAARAQCNALRDKARCHIENARGLLAPVT